MTNGYVISLDSYLSWVYPAVPRHHKCAIFFTSLQKAVPESQLVTCGLATTLSSAGTWRRRRTASLRSWGQSRCWNSSAPKASGSPPTLQVEWDPFPALPSCFAVGWYMLRCSGTVPHIEHISQHGFSKHSRLLGPNGSEPIHIARRECAMSGGICASSRNAATGLNSM